MGRMGGREGRGREGKSKGTKEKLGGMGGKEIMRALLPKTQLLLTDSMNSILCRNFKLTTMHFVQLAQTLLLVVYINLRSGRWKGAEV